MIACKACSTLNSLDSAFCKSCGKALPAEDALDAREQLDRKIDEGFELFHHGRTDEASLLSETALASDPTNLRALSLKAMVLERRGLLAEALETYETIVARDPNAALERMKVQTLRGIVQARYLTPPTSDRRTKAMIAAAAAILVISGAGIVALLSQRPSAGKVAQADPNAVVKMDTFAGSAESETATAPKTSGTPGPTPATPEPQETQRPAEQRLPDNVPSNSLLPRPSSEVAGGEVKPLNPLAGAEIRPIPSQSQSLPSAEGSGVLKADPEPTDVPPPKPEAPSGPPPLVDIQLSDPSQTSGSEQRIDASGVEALVRTARGQYQVGNYQAAATTYEKALRSGADPAMVNQRLGQCYDKLGRTSDATAAYNRAIAAIQNAISSGRGNRELLMAALESSKQALENLQGG